MTKKQGIKLTDYRAEVAHAIVAVRRAHLRLAELRAEEADADKRGEILPQEWADDMAAAQEALDAAIERRAEARHQLRELEDEIDAGAEIEL